MPLCITCSHPLPHLYTIYSKADDRTLGKGVRLTQCPNCKRFADKYVEHDYVVLFIDLVLIKPQVYRHLLFNRLNNSNISKDALDPSILRLGILLVLFDVYITWARIERGNAEGANGSVLTSWPIVGQYVFFLTLNIIATLAQHLTIRSLARYILRRSNLQSPTEQPPFQTIDHTRSSSHQGNLNSTTRDSSGQSHARQSSADPTSSQSQSHLDTDPNTVNTPRPGHASPSAISTALLVSSCTKLFPILLVIWPTTTSSSSQDSSSSFSSSLINNGPFTSRAASSIGWVVLVNNIEALLILLDCGYAVATGLAVAGMIARYVVEGWLLGVVGLFRDDSGPVGDFVALMGWVGARVSG